MTVSAREIGHCQTKLSSEQPQNMRALRNNPMTAFWKFCIQFEAHFQMFTICTTQSKRLAGSFSALERVGICGRIYMSSSRSSTISKVDAHKILRHFNAIKNRRLQFF